MTGDMTGYNPSRAGFSVSKIDAKELQRQPTIKTKDAK